MITHQFPLIQKMVFKTVTLFSVAILLASHQLNAELPKTESQDIWDLAHQLLNELTDFAEESIDGAIYFMETSIADINSIYGDITEQLLYVLKNFNATVTEDLNYLKELASNASVDIQQCLDGNEEELDGLSDLALNKYRLCGNGAYKRLHQKSQDLEITLNSSLTNIYELKNVLDSCGETDSQCISTVIGKIADDDDAFSNQLFNVVAQYYMLVIGFQEVVLGSERLQATKTVQRGDQIMRNITECVHEIIGFQ